MMAFRLAACLRVRRIVSMLILLVCLLSARAEAQTFTVLCPFNFGNGGYPMDGLTLGADGNFYGTTSFGGVAGSLGNIFRITPAGVLTILYNFVLVLGNTPEGGLTQGPDGSFYGTTYGGGTSKLNIGTIFKITPSGTLTYLHSFYGSDGENPTANLTLGADGNFYGTTKGGGAYGGGTVFRITPAGAFTLLYSFSGPDGAGPASSLTPAPDGSFYGTTYGGGANGSGTIYRITSAGALTTVYSFGADSEPTAGVTFGADGNLYGTAGGGTRDMGVVYKLTPSGVFTVLHSFTGPDGDNPIAGLTLGPNGDLYGTTYIGGPESLGNIFKITPSGDFTDLHDFNAGDGDHLWSGVTFGPDGNLYGTTLDGGSGGYGTVYRLRLKPTLMGLEVSPASVVAGGSATGKVTIIDPAATQGATVALSADSDVSVPKRITIPAGQKSATFVINTPAVKTATAAQITASLNGDEMASTLTIKPIIVAGLTISTRSGLAGYTTSGTVTISKPALTGGMAITLKSSSAAASVPASVTIPEGDSAANFTIATNNVTASTTVQIEAAANGSDATANLTVKPITPARLTLSPNTLTAGQTSTATITLNAPALKGGLKVALSSDAGASVPATVTVSAGATSAQFTVTTHSVTHRRTVNVQAAVNSGATSAALTINPVTAFSLALSPTSVQGGTSSTATITLAAPAPAPGITFTLSSANTGVARLNSGTLTIGTGKTTGSVAITTSAVKQNASVTISAAFAGVTRQAVLTVTP